MSSRAYLSIGDVLTLLRREFPDVTISKIRFLESQGLVDPERTPSGYRKFYDHDVERLRWVLRQQREHFLPLKVIKGRLEEEADAGTDGAQEAAVAVAPSDAGEASGSARPRSVRVAGGQGRSGSGEAAASGSAAPAGAGTDKAASAPRHLRHQELPGLEEGLVSARPAAADSRSARSSSREAVAAASRHPSAGAGTGSAPSRMSGRLQVAGSGHRARGESANAGRSRARTGPRAATAEEAGGGAVVEALPETSSTLDELAEASGLELADLRELESFGLISGRVVGGVAYYDPDALAVALLAASFSTYGVEPRHLRLHLLAAQREAGFVEQVVLPLLKQRNPESRQRAHETVAELSRLGQELRAVLLQRSLRELLGG